MFIILILVAIYSFVAITSYSSSYAQKTILATTAKIIPLRISTAVNSPLDTSKTVATSVALIPKLKILSPYYGQKVPVTNNNSLVVYGTSSYDRSKNCSVSVLLNGVKPYQRTVATGNNGASDYSTWKYKLDHSYAAVKEGSNKLTAKITCLDNPYSLTKWTSVHLIGSTVDNDRTTITSIAQPRPLRISTSVDKNPIIAGDIQTITVRESA